MDVNYAIPFMSKDWIVANTLSLMYFISIMGIGKILSKKNRIIFIKYFVYLFITSYIKIVTFNSLSFLLVYVFPRSPLA